MAINEVWRTVSVISAAVAALAALISVFLMYKSQQKERASKRPYIVIEAPGFYKLEDNSIIIKINFKNIGLNPALDFSGELRIISKDFTNEQKFSIDISNAVAPNLPFYYAIDKVRFTGDNIPKYYIYLTVNYLDPMLNKNFNQEFFLKWKGAEQGKMAPEFFNVSSDETNKIIEFISSH